MLNTHAVILWQFAPKIDSLIWSRKHWRSDVASHDCSAPGASLAPLGPAPLGPAPLSLAPPGAVPCLIWALETEPLHCRSVSLQSWRPLAWKSTRLRRLPRLCWDWGRGYRPRARSRDLRSGEVSPTGCCCWSVWSCARPCWSGPWAATQYRRACRWCAPTPVGRRRPRGPEQWDCQPAKKWNSVGLSPSKKVANLLAPPHVNAPSSVHSPIRPCCIDLTLADSQVMTKYLFGNEGRL